MNRRAIRWIATVALCILLPISLVSCGGNERGIRGKWDCNGYVYEFLKNGSGIYTDKDGEVVFSFYEFVENDRLLIDYELERSIDRPYW